MSSMSRRFYVRLAAQYLEAKPPIENEGRYATWLHMVYITANTINEMAGTFDRERFLSAAGVVTDPVGASA